MKRKLIAVITVLALCLSLLIPSASVFAETELPYWDKSVIIDGRTLTLTVTSRNAAGVLGGGVVELEYDPDVLEFQSTSNTGLSDSSNICGVVNGLSYLNTFIANFASAKSFNEDRTLVIATFKIKDGKTCTGNPFNVVRDRLIDSGDGTNARPVKQINIDSEGNTVTPAVKFSCLHSILTDWEITKKPTYTEDGERIQRCAACETVIKTEKIDKLKIDDLPYWEKTVVADGRKVTVTVKSVNGAGILAGGAVGLKYDPEVLRCVDDLATIRKSRTLSGLSVLNVEYPTEDGGVAIFVNLANGEAIEEDGVLFSAVFEVIEGKSCGETPFTIDREDMFGINDEGDATIPHITAEPTFTCNHKDSKVETNPATCIKEGSETTTCNVCGKTETKVLEIIDHDYTVKASETPATCTAGGKIVWKCATCDKTKEEPLEALGHNWDNGTITKAPTCTEKGIKTIACTRCDETKTEDVDALGHNWDNGTITKAPTCTEKGVKTIACTRCSETKTEDIAAAGHKPGNQVTEVEPTLTENGIARIRCTVCDEILEEVILPKLLKYGDVNANGVVDSNDAILILRYDAKVLSELTESQKLAANVDGTEVIDSNDAILILRFDAKTITKFPVEDKKAD